MKPLVIVHGGVGAPEDWADGCGPAADAGLAVLVAGGTALDAVVAATRVLEDDGRFNAGIGSVLRMDGKTIETDAGLMDDTGRIGAVAALREVRNPILVARAVMDTPHVLLAGEGATRFARMRGLAPGDFAPHPAAVERHGRAVEMLRERTSKRPRWRDADLASLWNFEGDMPEELRPLDTVGAVARDGRGRFAASCSTGGATPMMLGRVGDSPLPGAGFWAGPAGAVTATGVGEEIIRTLASKAVYDLIAAGTPATDALAAAAARVPDHVSFGALAVTADGDGVFANRTMPLARAAP